MSARQHVDGVYLDEANVTDDAADVVEGRFRAVSLCTRDCKTLRGQRNAPGFIVGEVWHSGAMVAQQQVVCASPAKTIK